MHGMDNKQQEFVRNISDTKLYISFFVPTSLSVVDLAIPQDADNEKWRF